MGSSSLRDSSVAFEVKDRFYEIGSLAGLEQFRQFIASSPTNVALRDWPSLRNTLKGAADQRKID